MPVRSAWSRLPTWASTTFGLGMDASSFAVIPAPVSVMLPCQSEKPCSDCLAWCRTGRSTPRSPTTPTPPVASPVFWMPGARTSTASFRPMPSSSPTGALASRYRRALPGPTAHRWACGHCGSWVCWHLGISMALRAAFWLVACGQVTGVCPAHPWGLLAPQLCPRGLLVRWGRGRCWCPGCYSLVNKRLRRAGLLCHPAVFLYCATLAHDSMRNMLCATCFFFCRQPVLHLNKLLTNCLQPAPKKKARYRFDSELFNVYAGARGRNRTGTPFGGGF